MSLLVSALLLTLPNETESHSWATFFHIASSLFFTPHWQGCNITGLFFWGGTVIFPDFFPGRKFHFGRLKTNFRRFQKWKAKEKEKKKKKKRSSPLFITFPTSIPIFHLPFYNFPSFSFFSSQFSPLFPFLLASFFPIRQQKFPGQKSLGALCPLPPPPPACYATAHWSIFWYLRIVWVTLVVSALDMLSM